MPTADIQIRLPAEMSAAIDRSRGITRWVREAAAVYLDRGYGWELPLVPLRRGVDYARLRVRLPGELVERLREQAAGQGLGRGPHAMAGYVRRIIAWRLAKEQDAGLILRNGGIAHVEE